VVSSIRFPLNSNAYGEVTAPQMLIGLEIAL
jgi:hypothetical protein